MRIDWKSRLEKKIVEVDEHFKRYGMNIAIDQIVSAALADARRIKNDFKTTPTKIKAEIIKLDGLMIK